METSAGFLLGGLVRYAQPVQGYRTGIEPVMLAATVPAEPGQRVLEAGTGAGAALLCLAARVAGLTGLGIERDPDMAGLARYNMAENGAPFSILTADITQPFEARQAVAGFDHVLANPPWHAPVSTRPPHPRRDAATHRGDGGLSAWITALAAFTAPRGTLSLVLPASLTGEAMALLHGTGLGRIGLLPLWPRTGVPAKIVLLQARSGNGPSSVDAGLVLHGDASGYTAAAEAVLRGGAALPFGAAA